MSLVVEINPTTSLVQYNQTSASLPYTVPVPKLSLNIPGRSLVAQQPQSVQPATLASYGSINAELAAGLLQPNPALTTSPNQSNPGAASTNGSPLVPLGAAAQSLSTGLTFQFDNAENQTDPLNAPSIYSPSMPVYNFPMNYLNDSYTAVTQQTPPSTASQEFLQTFAAASGRNYGNY